MLISYSCSKLLISILASSPPLMIPCRFFFISLNAAFISSFMLLLYSMSSLSNLITSVLNSASHGWLYPFCLVLFLGFYSVLSFGPYFFVSSIWQPPCVCFCVLGRAALTSCLSKVAYCRKDTHLDECGFLKSVVVRLPYCLIFWWFWVLFVLRSNCNPFCGCARRRSMSTYTSILTGSLKNRNVFLTVLEAGSGRSGSQHGQGVVRTLFRLQTAKFLLYPQMVERGKENSLESLL